MGKCGDAKGVELNECDPCLPSEPQCGHVEAGGACENGPIGWFADQVGNSLEFVKAGAADGKHVVGICCEYTPRELIMAAGGMPVCLCGGFESMIHAAEEYLPSNLCPLIKSTFGFSVNKANPFLEMAELIVAETTCDGKKKMYELLAETRRMHVLELPQKANDPDAFEHWVRELKKLKEALEEQLGVTVTDDSLRKAIKQMNEERGLKRDLAGLLKVENPPISGRELLDMKSLVSCMPEDMKQYRAAIESLPGRECAAGNGVRVLLTGVPVPHGAERVVDIIEGNGGLIVCQENCTGLKPLLEDVDDEADDPLRAIAEKYFHLPCSVMTSNVDRMDSIRQLAEEYRPQCIVELIWQACITYDVESRYVRQLADELDLPYLRIETDYSPSDSARIATRVQALFETAKGRARE